MRSRLPLLREYFEISLRALRFPFQIIRLHLPVSFQPISNGVRCFTHDSLLAFEWTKASVAGLLLRLVVHPETCSVIVSTGLSCWCRVTMHPKRASPSAWRFSPCDLDRLWWCLCIHSRVRFHCEGLSLRPLSMLWCLEKGLLLASLSWECKSILSGIGFAADISDILSWRFCCLVILVVSVLLMLSTFHQPAPEAPFWHRYTEASTDSSFRLADRKVVGKH